MSIDISSLKNRKTALVLSGGFIKAAAWHLGVAQALNELGFSYTSNQTQETDLDISTYVGSSAGSLVSTALASGISPQDMIDSLLEEKGTTRVKPIAYRDIFTIKRHSVKPPRPDLFNPLENFPFLIKTTLKPFSSINGLFTTQGVRDYILREILGGVQRFEELTADLFIVASHLDYSGKVIFGKHEYPNATHDKTAYYRTGIDIAEAASASMSVPPFYSPCPIKHPVTEDIEYFIDGEIRETLSTHVARDNNCETIISSWTHTPYHYQDEVGSLSNYGLPYIIIQSLQLMIEKKIITSRAKHNQAKDVLDTVNNFLKDEKFNEAKRKELTEILEKKLEYKAGIKYIDISPDPKDQTTFFAHIFSLSPDVNQHLVDAGYSQTMKVFKES